MNNILGNYRKLYSNSDFLISTFIYSQGHLLVEINWVNDSKAEFVFEDSPTLRADITKFWNGEAFVDAKKLLQAQKELKQRMYGTK